MKQYWVWLLMPFLLIGCAAEETFETVGDEAVLSVMAQPREISVCLPENAVTPVLENESEQVYLCEDYEIIIETLAAGDLNSTIRAVSGYNKEDLTVIETQWQDVTRYDFVWASLGEKGDRLGRAVILDDGNYHYCMSALRDADAEDAQSAWNDLFDSFALR